MPECGNVQFPRMEMQINTDTRPRLAVLLGLDDEHAFFRIPADTVIWRARSVAGLLALAEGIDNGVVILGAEAAFDRVVDTWRLHHPRDWRTVLAIGGHHALNDDTLAFLEEWPVPVLLSAPNIPARYLDGKEFDRLGHVASTSCRLIPLLASRVANIPAPLRAELIGTFGCSEPADTLKALAGRCGFSQRHARRAMASAGIVSSPAFFAGNRVLRAYRDVALGRRPLCEIAGRYGFGTPRTLHVQWEQMTGHSIETMRGTELTDDCVRSIGARIFTEPRRKQA